jgi:tRNA uridine 5-carbamoylmethylation protein Kti12
VTEVLEKLVDCAIHRKWDCFFFLLLLSNRGVSCAIDQIFSILRVVVGIHLFLRGVVIFHII